MENTYPHLITIVNENGYRVFLFVIRENLAFRISEIAPNDTHPNGLTEVWRCTFGPYRNSARKNYRWRCRHKAWIEALNTEEIIDAAISHSNQVLGEEISNFWKIVTDKIENN